MSAMETFLEWSYPSPNKVSKQTTVGRDIFRLILGTAIFSFIYDHQNSPTMLTSLFVALAIDLIDQRLINYGSEMSMLTLLAVLLVTYCKHGPSDETAFMTGLVSPIWGIAAWEFYLEHSGELRRIKFHQYLEKVEQKRASAKRFKKLWPHGQKRIEEEVWYLEDPMREVEGRRVKSRRIEKWVSGDYEEKPGRGTGLWDLEEIKRELIEEEEELFKYAERIREAQKRREAERWPPN